MADDGKILINLRILASERDAIKRAADKAGRTLPSEILYRLGLGQYRGGTPGQADRAIADLAAVVTERSESALVTILPEVRLWLGDDAGGSEQRARLLTVVREAIVKALDDLGAGQAAELDVTPAMIANITWDLATRIKSPSNKDAESEALGRIGRNLGFGTHEAGPKGERERE